jgi:hypothetical protein
MTKQELLADALLSTKLLVGRYLTDFTDVTRVRQTPDLPNHVAWSLGHLAITMLRVVEKINGTPPPADEFVTTGHSQGSIDHGYFDTEAVSFGSRSPDDQYHHWPTLERSRAIFDRACDALAATVRGLNDAELERPIQWGTMQIPIWSAITRMIFHNGSHTGQIADLRRALGMKSIFA